MVEVLGMNDCLKLAIFHPWRENTQCSEEISPDRIPACIPITAATTAAA